MSGPVTQTPTKSASKPAFQPFFRTGTPSGKASPGLSTQQKSVGTPSGLAAQQKAIRQDRTAAQSLVSGKSQKPLGRWARAKRWVKEKLLRGMCKAAGIDPGKLLMLARAAGAAAWRIYRHPLDFARTLSQAVVGGFRAFGRNIWTHLKAGLVGWLTGALSQAGLQLPARFDALGIFSLVAQILNLTPDALEQRARKKIGDKAVDRIKAAVGLFAKLRKEGVAGLWKELKGFLGGLRGQVMGAIRSWVVTRVVTAAVEKVASMFTPASALVQLVKTAAQVVSFLLDNVGRLAGLFMAVARTVVDLAHGRVAKSVKAIEGVLARMLPLAIGLLARLMKLGGLPEKIKAVLKTVRDKVDAALSKLWTKLVQLAKRLKPSKRKEVKGEGDVTKAERKSHERWAKAMVKALKAPPKEKGGKGMSFAAFHANRMKLAEAQKQKYQPKVRKGIKVGVDFLSVEKDKGDNDVDFTVWIRPNSTKVTGAANQPSDLVPGSVGETTVDTEQANHAAVKLNLPCDGRVPKEDQSEAVRSRVVMQSLARHHFRWLFKAKIKGSKKKLGHAVMSRNLGRESIKKDMRVFGESVVERATTWLGKRLSKKKTKNKVATLDQIVNRGVYRNKGTTTMAVNGREYMLDKGSNPKSKVLRPAHCFAVGGSHVWGSMSYEQWANLARLSRFGYHSDYSNKVQRAIHGENKENWDLRLRSTRMILAVLGDTRKGKKGKPLFLFQTDDHRKALLDTWKGHPNFGMVTGIEYKTLRTAIKNAGSSGSP